MGLHSLTDLTVGVPNLDAAAAYYVDFGLTPSAPHPQAPSGFLPDAKRSFSTVDGGEQFTLVHSARRRLLQLTVAVDDQDDLERISRSLTRLELAVQRQHSSLTVTDPGTDVEVKVQIGPRLIQPAVAVPPYNSPGISARPTSRAPGILREGPVRPRKLGHVVIGSTDQPASERFFTDGIGFKVSDRVPGLAAFMRCSTDHHNVLVQQAPVTLLHHTSWQVDDVDEVGRGATAMLAKDPSRHVWGLGRHHIGSNFFWYLKDPAGNFSEYYSDLDCIVDDELWTPHDWADSRALYSWGPPMPPSFLHPEDLAELMTATHAPG